MGNLCRFTLKHEHLVTDVLVKGEIAKAFDEHRAFPFIPDAGIIDALRAHEPPERFNDDFIAIKNGIFDELADDDQTRRARFRNDARLSSRIVDAVSLIHRAIAENIPSMAVRRFVLIEERPGSPTLYHVSDETTVISHVGQGPQWEEIPSVYLGLNIFDTLQYHFKRGERTLYEAFTLLLMVEERAIETGYTHTEIFSPAVSTALNALVDEVIRLATLDKIPPEEIRERRAVRRFSAAQRNRFLRLLDARLENDVLNFDYEKNVQAITSLERLARRYKRGDDLYSLREIVRLLVAASGHDIHEVRNRANIILERIFSPKEFDAPLATSFFNLRCGETFTFQFSLPVKKGMCVRIYSITRTDRLHLERDNAFLDISLRYDAKTERYVAEHLFDACGHYDFTVIRKKKRGYEWVSAPMTSGRINVIPEIDGEIILEVFPDIHGHTRAYWRDGSGHPGLVYNENGEVIRLGKFSDITSHLDDLQKRYAITALYLLGVQRRGTNRKDWAPEATSPSPFSPMSLVEIEPSLGGETEFVELVRAAHERGMKVIVDIVPHLNRQSTEMIEHAVYCYDDAGKLVVRASTDGRFGSWNDGMLLNYRRFEVWEWLCNSILTLVEQYDVDGIRFDSAHAVPIMMKRNNYPAVYKEKRSHEEMLEGTIIVNDREDDHYITTGYYDAACRESIAIPLHYYIMQNVERKLKELGKEFFIYIAECYWGHERYLARTGIMPYNSALFKICENIIHGKTDVREIYHIYDNYFPLALPQGTEMVGILGNHDERRALNTFGHRGLRAAVALTIFMSSIIMDYEGSAEGEGWKVYLDNIYVNWNQFEYAAHRSLERFYDEWYRFHRGIQGRGYLIWANNVMVAAAMRSSENGHWIGVFNFADGNQTVSLQFDNPALPIPDDNYYRVEDPLYSPITGHYSYFTGRELKVSKIHTVASFTERVKLLKLVPIEDREEHYRDFLRDSFFRLCSLSRAENFRENFSFLEIVSRASDFEQIREFLSSHLASIFWNEHRDFLELGLKRAFYHLFRNDIQDHATLFDYFTRLAQDEDERLEFLGRSLQMHNERGSLVFMSAEAEPFSKSGGLANVVYELPRELVKQGEEVYVITPLYRHGDEKSVDKMKGACEQYNVRYTGRNVHFKMQSDEYTVGVHSGEVEGVRYYLLDHYEFFDGLYWGFTAEEKIKKRIAFARACAELIVSFGLRPHFTFTNDAFAGLFNGIVRSDPYYADNSNFSRTTFLHVIHNGGWQYFDLYHRYEGGSDHFRLFNLPSWKGGDFCDPVNPDRINCMAAGARFADRVITVSPSYARQIEYACDGLEIILHDVIGISNAIGEDFSVRILQKFNRSGFQRSNFDRFRAVLDDDAVLREKVERRFPEILRGLDTVLAIEDPVRRDIVVRALNKMLVQVQRGFTVDPEKMLIAMIHRIAEQKGFQLLLDASEGIFNELGIQAIIGGAVASGDNRGEEIAHGLYLLNRYYGENVSVIFGFQDVSVPLLSADIFCMPSMNEPGGISQLEAFACGCPVLARATGGLRDTVFPVRMTEGRVEGNGFLFSDYNAWAFYDAMKRAFDFFQENSDSTIYKVRKNAESSVYFWEHPAKRYIEEIYNIKEIIRVVP